ncbi:Large-conductance mechanosensitive channel [Microbacterium sp. 8M]|jgi:large conductance mechanosensitive channel|uniref:large conductance mechanosensitive channel protein MscL n=1 Tax=Microbacterium sp. 8M TaxID=2653153 RepID=UPI0012F104AF|nr:large conductance mechanosensitive channel protein MscL [Microbacterium sp. 8M]VXB96359.1 Large-conductance mechanosensitive channel [Microbacterium sp. 8M]
MIKGFKEFILRGNVIDLAVAVVIGAAFSAIVDAVVKGLINPLIALFFSAKSLDGLVLAVPNFQGGHTDFAIGSIIGAIINFLAVAVVVYFAFVMPMNHFKERQAAKAGLPEEPEALPTEQELLIQIRDLLEKQRSA